MTTGVSRDQPLVSVIIATYNCAEYVGQAIESVLGQTYSRLELQVVNDGSTDGTTAVVARYAGDPRVHYHEQRNAGQTRAKNRGISAATGDFVAFCDADDVWLPDKLTIQMPAFEGNGRIGVVYSRATPIAPDGAALVRRATSLRHASGRVTEQLFKSNIVPFGTAVVRRACLLEMGAFDERYRMGIDWELWLRLSTRYEFRFVDAETYLYRIWPGQMSHNWRGRYEAAFQIMRAFLARHPGLVRRSVIREAWADCFMMRARARALQAHEYLPALADLARALRFHPADPNIWKSMAYVAAIAAGRRTL